MQDNTNESKKQMKSFKQFREQIEAPGKSLDYQKKDKFALDRNANKPKQIAVGTIAKAYAAGMKMRAKLLDAVTPKEPDSAKQSQPKAAAKPKPVKKAAKSAKPKAK